MDGWMDGRMDGVGCEFLITPVVSIVSQWPLFVVQAHRIYSTLRFLTQLLWEWIQFSVPATGFH